MFSKIIILGFLVMGTIGLIFMDFQGVFTGNLSGNTIVLTSKSGDLSLPEFDRIYRNQVRQMRISNEQAAATGFPQMILNYQAQQFALLDAAKKYGFAVSPQLLNDILRKSDSNLNVASLKTELHMSGVSESQFLNSIEIEQFYRAILNAIQLQPFTQSPVITSLFNRINNKEMTILAKPITVENITPDDAMLMAYYEQNILSYMQSSQAKLKLLLLDESKMLANIDIAQAQVQTLYNDEKSNATLEQEYTFTQYLFDAESNTDDLNAAKKTTSDFTLNDSSRLPIATDVIKDAKQAQPGDQLGPYTSPFGQHVFVYQGSKEKPFPSFNELREELTLYLKEEIMLEQLESLEQALVENGQSIQDVAKNYGLSIQDLTLSQDMQGDIPEILSQATELPALIADIFNPNSDRILPVNLRSGGQAYIQIESIDAASPKAFDLVKSEVKQDYISQTKETALAQAYAAMAIGDLNLAATIKGTTRILQADEALSNVTWLTLAQNLMQAPNPYELGMTVLPNGTAIAYALKAQNLANAENQENLDTIKTNEAFLEDIQGSFLQALLSKTSVKTYPERVQAAYSVQ